MGIRDNYFFATNDFVAKNSRPALYLPLPVEKIQAFQCRFKARFGYNIGVNRSDEAVTNKFSEVMLKHAYAETEPGSEFYEWMNESDDADSPYHPTTWDIREEAIDDMSRSSSYTRPDNENKTKTYTDVYTKERKLYTPYNNYIKDTEIDKRIEELERRSGHNR
jgi:hypothetical protein